MDEVLHGLGYGYKDWGNMGCFGNLSVCCSTSVIFSIVYRKDYLSSVNVGIVSQTTLIPCACLCELFIIFLFLNYYHLLQSGTQQSVSDPRFRLGNIGEILRCRT